MSVRFIAQSDFVCADKLGRKREFKAGRRYAPKDVEGLYRDQLARFNQVDWEPVVEQATAAPGEKRTRQKKDE